jgi:hypothetical protein
VYTRSLCVAVCPSPPPYILQCAHGRVRLCTTLHSMVCHPHLYLLVGCTGRGGLQPRGCLRPLSQVQIRRVNHQVPRRATQRGFGPCWYGHGFSTPGHPAGAAGCCKGCPGGRCPAKVPLGSTDGRRRSHTQHPWCRCRCRCRGWHRDLGIHVLRRYLPCVSLLVDAPSSPVTQLLDSMPPCPCCGMAQLHIAVC